MVIRCEKAFWFFSQLSCSVGVTNYCPDQAKDHTFSITPHAGITGKHSQQINKKLNTLSYGQMKQAALRGIADNGKTLNKFLKNNYLRVLEQN